MSLFMFQVPSDTETPVDALIDTAARLPGNGLGNSYGRGALNVDNHKSMHNNPSRSCTGETHVSGQPSPACPRRLLVEVCVRNMSVRFGRR